MLIVAATLAAGADKGGGWMSMFDGKTLDGWKINESPESWTVVDGTLQGKGPVSHLFYMKEQVAGGEFKADIKLAHNSNSGMYFRTEFGPKFPKGYEAQVNNSHRDPVRTGSLYNFVKVYEHLVDDDTWWSQHIVFQGNHIVIKVNNKVLVDYIDELNTFTKGHFALQQHDPGSMVQYKNLMYRKTK